MTLAANSKIIAYIRVSTARQGKSGLGIDAQREAIARFAAAEGLELAGEHVEVETGKGTDALDRRPVLREALAQARKAKVAVVVAKLDRLSRDVAFIAGLMSHRVPFIVAELARIIHRTARNRPRPPNTWARNFIAKNFIKQPIRIVVSDINGLALIAHFS